MYNVKGTVWSTRGNEEDRWSREGQTEERKFKQRQNNCDWRKPSGVVRGKNTNRTQRAREERQRGREYRHIAHEIYTYKWINNNNINKVHKHNINITPINVKGHCHKCVGNKRAVSRVLLLWNTPLGTNVILILTWKSLSLIVLEREREWERSKQLLEYDFTIS